MATNLYAPPELFDTEYLTRLASAHPNVISATNLINGAQSGRFFVTWNGLNYRLHPTTSACLATRPTSGNQAHIFVEIDQWGHIRTTGTTNITATTVVHLTEVCNTSLSRGNQYNLYSYGAVTTNLFDAPAFSPYQPFYIGLALCFAIFLFTFSMRLFWGGKSA